MTLETALAKLQTAHDAGVRVIGFHPSGARLAWVTSGSQPGLVHLASDRECTCEAHTLGRPGLICRHQLIAAERGGWLDAYVPGIYTGPLAA